MIIGRLDFNDLELGEGEHLHDATAFDNNDCYTGDMCLMEACSAAAELFPINDMPACTSPPLARVSIALNDAYRSNSPARTSALGPLIPLLIKTRNWSADGIREVLEAMAEALIEHTKWHRPPYWHGMAPLNTLADIVRDAINEAVAKCIYDNSGDALSSTALLRKLAEAFRTALSR